MFLNAGLYFDDAYARSFEANVIAVDGNHIALDRTIFCPGERGQSPDRGWLHWQQGNATVASVNTSSGMFWHYVDGVVPALGTTISGELDWNYRHQMMRTHTALHLVNALAFYIGCALPVTSRVLPTGLQIQCRSAFWNHTLRAEIERRVNEAITADLPVHTYTLSREEAKNTPLLNQTKVAMLPQWMTEVRVMEIEGISLDIDTGTHVRSTREIGGLQYTTSVDLGNEYHQTDLVLRDAPMPYLTPNRLTSI